MRTPSRRVPRGSWTALLIFAFTPTLASAQTAEPASVPSPDYQSEYDSLEKDFKEAQEAFYKAYSEIDGEEAQMAFWSDASKNPNQIFAARYRAFAERAGSHPAAAKAWMWFLQSSQDADEKARVVDRMLENFLDAPAIADFAQFLQYAEWSIGRPKTVGALRTIREKSQNELGRQTATLTLGIVQMNATSEAGKAESRALLDELLREAPDSPSGKRAVGYLYELDHLQIGMIAPEIEGTDSEGKSFKLSDYRGQVVVLDFWGFW